MGSDDSRLRPDLRRFRLLLHLTALSTFAVTQPVLDMLARTPDFFVARDLSARQILLLTVLLLLTPVACLAAFAEAVGLVAGRSGRRSGYLVALGLLASAFLLLVLRRVPVHSVPVAAMLASGGALVFVWAYLRSEVVRGFLTILVPLSAVPPLVFLLASPAARLVTAEPRETSLGLRLEHPDMPVVMVVLDELPASSLVTETGTVDASLFPNLAQLESVATRYPDHAAAAISTLDALPAILTGLYPRPDRLATLDDFPGNLFTLLSGSHQLFVFEPRTRLCPQSLRWRTAPPRLGPVIADLGVLYLHLVLPAGLTHRLPDVTTNWEQLGRLADKPGMLEDFFRSLPSSTQGDRPPFVFVHAELPHHPWIYLPSGRWYYPGKEVFIDGIAGAKASLPGRWIDDRWITLQALQRHLLQTAYVDRLLGELFQRLRAAAIFDDALVVVTADHGLSFQSGTKVRALEPDNVGDIAGVPLWIKRPGQTTAAVDPRSASAVDLVPTMAEIMGIDLPWQTDGASLADPRATLQRPRAVFNQPPEGVLLGALPPPQERFAAVERLRAFPPTPTGPERLLRLVPDALPALADLLGIEPSQRAERRSELRAEIDYASSFLEVDPAAGRLPARVTGQLVAGSGEVKRPVLALSVSGRVQAVTVPRSDPGFEGAFSFMVADDVWQKGHNQLGLFEVTSSPESGLRLRQVPLPEAISYELVRGIGGRPEAILASTGPRYRISATTRASAVGHVDPGGGHRIRFMTVVKSVPGGLQPSCLLAFDGDEFLLADLQPRVDPHLGSVFLLDLPGTVLSADTGFFLLDADGTAYPVEYSLEPGPEGEPTAAAPSAPEPAAPSPR